MSDTVGTLYALQQLQFGPGSKDSFSRISQLRRSISADILAKYDRLASRGKKPVAVVRRGVCSQCHIGLAVGARFELTQDSSPCTCDNCGRFLYLPESEAAEEKHAAPAAA